MGNSLDNNQIHKKHRALKFLSIPMLFCLSSKQQSLLSVVRSDRDAKSVEHPLGCFARTQYCNPKRNDAEEQTGAFRREEGRTPVGRKSASQDVPATRFTWDF